MTIEFLHTDNLKTQQEKIFTELKKIDPEEISDETRSEFVRVLAALESGKFKLTNHELFYLSRANKDIWPEYLVFREKFQRLSSEKLKTDFPLYLLLEPTSICNLRCVMCFQIDKSFSGNKEYMGRMDLELFKRLIDEAHEGGTRAITLASRGDPTLHKQLPEMLEYMKGKFLEIKLNTNGIVFSEELARCILSTEVTDLVFSIDSYEKENYEEIRRKAKFEKVVANIKMFMDIRQREFPNHRTSVRVSGVKVDQKQDREMYNKFWSELVDHVVLVDILDRWDTYNNDPLDPEMLDPCVVLWERMYVWWDGTVNPCDVDYKSTLGIGNVHDSSIRELWTGEKYEAMRQKHLGGQRHHYEVCAQCNYCVKGA